MVIKAVGTERRGRRTVDSDIPLNSTSERISAVLSKAAETGLLDEKSSRISGRVSTRLIARAKARTGLTSDTKLVEFALASLALEDDFAATFIALRASVDPELTLEF